MALYLGLDSSTQSLTALVIEVTDSERRVVLEETLNFDADLPQYGTRNGVLSSDDPQVVHSSPQLWTEALDGMLGQLAGSGAFDLSELKAIACSGQQHGSVYLNASATGVLQSLDSDRGLVEQLQGIFSRSTSPIWMDSSTGAECAAIRDTVGGEAELARLTGSGAFERFTGPQIRKFAESEPEAYRATDRIHLVSSYIATLLHGSHAPIDTGDGAGMNLMDLAGKTWAPQALAATAPDLDTKLPPIVDASTVVGKLAPYWVERYGYSPQVDVVASSGDNPCSLIGVGLVKPGRIAISLGTSDTLFGFLPEPVVDTEGRGHVFGSPTGHYMSLICFVNGSLARERIRDAAGYDWAEFERALRETPVGNNGKILLPWFQPEITPRVPEPQVRRYGLDAEDHPANVRAVVEAQMMAMAIHSQWMGVDVDTVYATGGAAANREILRVIADVHNADVYQLETGNSAALGAALRAYHADAGRGKTWDDITRGFVEPVAESRISPTPENVEIYRELKECYAACEAHALGRGDDPSDLLARFR